MKNANQQTYIKPRIQTGFLSALKLPQLKIHVSPVNALDLTILQSLACTSREKTSLDYAIEAERDKAIAYASLRPIR
jgi:hypothetical protein